MISGRIFSALAVALTLTFAAAPLLAQEPVVDEKPAGQQPVKFELADSRLILPGPIVFETGTDTITADSEPALLHVKAFLEAKEYVTLMRIECHGDNSGSPEEIQALTMKRSKAVAAWLVAKGVDCKRLIPVGFGDTKPIASNATAEGRATNSRTAFVNAELRGRAIGGMPVDGGGMVSGDPCIK